MAARATVGGRYRSLFVVGRGGMGSVEAALQLGTTERIVALKRLLPDAARDRRRVDMFLREAKLAQMLEHPNVVTAYDYGEIDGDLYLAMEYVEGQPLSRALKALADAHEELPVTVVAYVLAEVCRGLHAAHELSDPQTGQALNLVHRDVSPQNVMLGYDGRVRLLDFGVAKIETENVTKTGEVKGKTAYMSPEQAMGDPLDRRSDLFGVGALLFECLALSRMWGDGTDMEVIRKLALEEPPGLEKTGRSGLPASLTDLHRRMVARDRDGRPATAAEVATALEELVDDKAAAQASLKKLLDAHFAEQAEEQRAKLNSSLHEVAPAQADALRESVHPSNRPPKPERPAPPAPAAAKPSSAARYGLLAAGLVIVGVLAWKLATPAASEPAKPDPTLASAALSALPTTATSATASAQANGPATAQATATPVASAPPTATPNTAATAAPSSRGPATMPNAPATAPATAPKTGPALRPSSSPAPAPVPAPARPPVPSAKPPEVFDKPF